MSPALPAQPSHRRLQPPPKPSGRTAGHSLLPPPALSRLGAGCSLLFPYLVLNSDLHFTPVVGGYLCPGTRLLPGGHSGRARVSHLPTSAQPHLSHSTWRPQGRSAPLLPPLTSLRAEQTPSQGPQLPSLPAKQPLV